MHVVTVEFEIKQEHQGDFRTAVLEQAATSLACEEACQCFDVCFAEEAATQVFLYELYDDRTSFEKHLISEHFKKFDERVRPWIETKTVKCWRLETK